MRLACTPWRDQVVHGRLRAPLAERQVVLVGAALVAVALDQHEVVVGLQPRRVGVEHLRVGRPDIVLVEVEEDVLEVVGGPELTRRRRRVLGGGGRRRRPATASSTATASSRGRRRRASASRSEQARKPRSWQVASGQPTRKRERAITGTASSSALPRRCAISQILLEFVRIRHITGVCVTEASYHGRRGDQKHLSIRRGPG